MTNYSPVDYIKIDIANMMGLDKKTFPQRIAWVNSIKDLRSKTNQAEKPAQFLSAVMCLEDALAGAPSGHLVGLDACASGTAILGILAGCHTTSRNTGIIGKKRMDFYAEGTKEMNSILDGSISLPRDIVKTAIMTYFYGSKREPINAFGEDTPELFAFYEALERVAPGACMMMRALLSSWQPYALEHGHTMPDGFNAKVPVLEKMKAKIEIDELAHSTLTYIYEDNIGAEKGVAVAANATHAVDGFIVREVCRRCNYDNDHLRKVWQILRDSILTPSDTSVLQTIEEAAVKHKFISLRGVDYITEENILSFSLDYRKEMMNLIQEVLRKPSFRVIAIHDEFKCHPNYVNYMREVYRDVLVEIADSRMGEQIISEIRNDPTFQLNKLSDDLGDEIIKGEYWLS